MIVVADASPLILLGQVGQLELLRELFGEVLVPRSVWEEATDNALPGSEAVTSATWLVVRQDPEGTAPLDHLGRGEAMAFALARQVGADLLLVDDLQARKAARRQGVAVRGTLGVLVAAKEAGLVLELRPPIKDLIAAGMRVSDRLVDEVLRAAGE